ncbi:hypothetical protein LWP59_33330 [Amycolatopsis acidiphila]|uniref:EcsC family protein n=1 Tax=Amycolatopsis acidiphila TaxID=715473 RepID=A0A557ZX88_9PSEU|nr:hypothetical protein [Amycolatopsis acidiphila]TVT16616.1 hypothetical protein FNH06_34285 [Amycolatopsis acidiphila]UIJ58913.1 hypothetical protein LWP59_33330 [Amycolatopsis acidiphila]GHG72742.1 hypothetical protein GCM10017788_35500 [Amycolatopsis acidiphila]
MAEAISDRQLVKVLRPFVRAARPVLHAMCRPGRIEGLATVKLPGTAAWDAMSAQQHVDWWISRVGRLTSLVTAIPGIGGVLADRLPVQDALGASAQGLLLCAIAGEHGIDDVGERVRLVAWVLFQRDIDPALAAGKHGETEDAETAELAGEFGEQHERRITPKGVATTLWRMGRSLLAVSGELEKRPRGRFYQRAIGMLPVVGMAGDYLAERSGLKRVAKRADVWLSGART